MGRTAAQALLQHGYRVSGWSANPCTLQGVSTSQLRDWLAEARSGARARPVEARLARAAEGYSGTIVVALGGAL